VFPLSDSLTFDFPEVNKQPTYTYKFDPLARRISGFVDGMDAMTQSTMLLIGTERFSNVVYNADYGIQLYDCIGAPMDFVQTVLESRIKDSISVDDRYLDARVTSLVVEHPNILRALVDVTTIFGTHSKSLEVTLK
jgi:hypothetical protein